MWSFKLNFCHFSIQILQKPAENAEEADLDQHLECLAPKHSRNIQLLWQSPRIFLCNYFMLFKLWYIDWIIFSIIVLDWEILGVCVCDSSYSHSLSSKWTMFLIWYLTFLPFVWGTWGYQKLCDLFDKREKVDKRDTKHLPQL